MTPEETHEILLEKGFKYEGGKVFNSFNRKTGRSYLKENWNNSNDPVYPKEMVFFKENDFHIRRDNSTLFMGELKSMDELNTVLRILKV